MSVSMAKVRVVANACITRWERGERSMNDIINGYTMTEEDKVLITAEIISKRPNLDFDAR